MKFWKLKLGDADLPKYAYFYNAFVDIYKRVEINFPAIYGDYEALPPKTVLLYLCKSETENYSVELGDFSEVRSETMFQQDIEECSDIQYFLEHTIQPQTFTLLILSESLESQLRLKNKNMILIKVDEKKHFNLEEQRLSTTVDTVLSDTDSALEKVITSKVKPMYQMMEKHEKKQRRLPANRNGRLKNTDDLSQLVAEMRALLNISGGHHAEKKDKPYNTEITEELCDSLKAACPSVKRIGYTFSTLEIQAVLDEENEAKMKKKIRAVLKKFNILDFEITECLEEIHAYTWVGSKIKTDFGCGTLGCIVQDTDRNEQYGAVSKHVVELVDKVMLNTDRNDIPGTVVKATAEHEDGSLDIAAIKLREIADENNCKFKTSSGVELRGQLNDTFIREGRQVHIYGATSSPNPGRGVISCPRMKDFETGYPIITIRDAYNSTFANRGDSGAIVCADDPSGRNVFALGMVMGALDRAEKPTYAALPLSEGIQQLSRITGNELELM